MWLTPKRTDTKVHLMLHAYHKEQKTQIEEFNCFIYLLNVNQFAVICALFACVSFSWKLIIHSSDTCGCVLSTRYFFTHLYKKAYTHMVTHTHTRMHTYDALDNVKLITTVPCLHQ